MDSLYYNAHFVNALIHLNIWDVKNHQGVFQIQQSIINHTTISKLKINMINIQHFPVFLLFLHSVHEKIKVIPFQYVGEVES